MTLFHLREFWATNCGNEEEEFDKASLCICNIDNSPDGFDKIVLGSFNGILRVYKVEQSVESKNEQNLFQISDLLLEADLKKPIMQVASGYLLTPNNIQLAILHPDKLCVYSISSSSGVTEHGTSYNMLLMYEIGLEPKAINMLIAAADQSKSGKDMVCVQNTMSTFEFYENESFSFAYCWNREQSASGQQRKLPMEFVFVPSKRDLIVLVDELCLVQCYQYQELAINSSDVGGGGGGDSETNHKNCIADWTYDFGESVMDIQAVMLEKSWYLVILGERNLCVLRENGSLFFMKKFDANPSCLCAFANDPKDSLIILIGTHMSNMLVYQNEILRWATKIPFVPVCIRRATLNDVTGSIVLLSDQGQLTVGYLGTNPSLKIIPMPSSTGEAAANVEKMDQELKELKRLINFECNSLSDRENKMADYISVNVLSWQDVDDSSSLVLIEIVPLTALQNVKILFLHNDFFDITPAEQLMEKLDIAIRFECQVRFKFSMLPLVTKIKCEILFSKDKVLRIITKSIAIPFASFIKPISSSAVQKYSIQLAVEKNANLSENKCQLTHLFDHVLDQNHPNGQYFAFCFRNYERIQAQINLTGTEDAIHYRVESNDPAGLYLTLKELFTRLEMKFPNYKLASMVMNFHPNEILRHIIKNRMDNKHSLLAHKNEIAKFSQHYRVLQKRILVKSKDKTPAPLDNLEKLLALVQQRISKNIERTLFFLKMMEINNYHVWVGLNLLKLIVKNAHRKETQSLERFLKLISVRQFANLTMEWEELFQASLGQIFNTSANGKDNNISSSSSSTNNTDTLTDQLNDMFRKLAKNFIPMEFIIKDH